MDCDEIINIKTDMNVNNQNVDMSSPISKGMEFKQFFGLHGAMPLAFTDRILQNSIEDSIFIFFDKMFADFITLREFKYYKIAHSYIKLFQKIKFQKLPTNKLIPIAKNFNHLGKIKLGFCIIGKSGLVC